MIINKRIRMWVEWLLRGGVLVALVAPLVVTPGLVFPFHTGRTIFFQIIVELLLPLWVWLLLTSPAHRLRKGWTLAALGFYALVLIVTTATSIDPSQSFWGRDERMMGTFTLLHLILWALMVASAFRGERALRMPIMTSVAVATAVSLATIHEHFFPTSWYWLSGGGSRAAATFGNPIFLANYLVPHVFFALWLAVVSDRRSRWIFVGALALILLAIVYSQTRGALLGVAAGAGMLAVGWISRTRGRRRAYLALGALGIIVLIGALFIGARQVPRLRNHPTLGPILQISPRLITAQERILLWKIAERAWEDRPLLGWGPENFDYAYDRHYDPQFLRFSLHETWVDRAHNIFLDALVASGIPGLIAVVALLVVPYLELRRRRNAGRISPEQAIVAGGLAAAVLVQDISAFDTLGSVLISMLFAGVAMGTEVRNSVIVSQSDRQAGLTNLGVRRSSFVRLRMTGLVGLAGIVMVSGMVINVRTTVGARALSAAISAETAADVLARGHRALDSRQPFQQGFRIRFGDMVFKGAGNRFKQPEEGRLLDYAIGEYQKTLKRAPGDFKTIFSIANLEFIKAIDADASRYDAARAYYQSALAVSPNRQIALFQIGNLDLIRGNASSAIEIFSRAVAADAKSAEPWWHLGRALVAHGGREADAYDAFERGRSLGYVPITRADIAAALPVYAARRDYEALLWLYEQAVVLDPENTDLWVSYAVVAADLGRADKTRAALERAVAIDPALRAEVDAFLKKLSW